MLSIALQPPEEEGSGRLTSGGFQAVLGDVETTFLLEKSTYFFTFLFFVLTLLTAHALQRRYAPKQDGKSLEQVTAYVKAQAKAKQRKGR